MTPHQLSKFIEYYLDRIFTSEQIKSDIDALIPLIDAPFFEFRQQYYRFKILGEKLLTSSKKMTLIEIDNITELRIDYQVKSLNMNWDEIISRYWIHSNFS